jgi:transposase-like protein
MRKEGSVFRDPVPIKKYGAAKRTASEIDRKIEFLRHHAGKRAFVALGLGMEVALRINEKPGDVERWSRFFAQGAKWNFCLTAGPRLARESGEPMKRRARRNHSSVFKAKVAVAAIKGDRTLAQLSDQFDVHANQISDWKDQLLECAAEVFERLGGKPSVPAVDIKALHAKIGELTLENDFLEAALGKAGVPSARR